MLELTNRTPFATHYVLLPNEQGIDTLYINVKASFTIGKSWTLCDEQIEPHYENVYWGEPGKSSLKYPTCVHPGKSGTDIAIIGHAWAPDNKPVQQLDVTATIGSKQKTLRVFGDRVWDQGRIGHAKTFVQMPIRYENAFGGQHWINEELSNLEPRNPVGKGFRGAKKIEEMNGQPLPNIENPQNLITDIADSPQPAGFGLIDVNWFPRASYAGTYDETWQKSRAPYLPLDYQLRFQHSAHPDLICNQHLTGGEIVTLTHMHPEGTIHFSVPHIKLGGKVKFHRLPEQSLHFVMETLIINVNTQQLIIDWKASCPCSNIFPLLNNINIQLLR